MSSGKAGNLRSIDPGTDWAGLALFWQGTLVQSSVLRDVQRLPVVHPNGYDPRDRVDVLVIEKPQIYPRSPANPNDQITLAINAGEWKQANPHIWLVMPHPRQWKGQVPKCVTQDRVLKALTPAELAILKPTQEEIDVIARAMREPNREKQKRMGVTGKRHNEYDAVGLGLWELGRYR